MHQHVVIELSVTCFMAWRDGAKHGGICKTWPFAGGS